MRSLVCLMFFLLVNVNYAQPYKILGIVFDEETRKPLPYCNISIVNSARGTTTNADGYYTIVVDQSHISLKYHYIGYQSQTHDFSFQSPNTLCDIYLKPIVLEFDSVTVIGYKNTEVERLILKASQRKEDSRKMLKNYSCYSYTKSSYRSQKRLKSFGGILEAFSEIYYNYPNSYQEIVRSQRQSANIPRSINYLTGDTFLDINSDRIVSGNKQIIGPTAHDAIDHYHYEIIDTLYEDHDRLIQIRFTPTDDRLPLMQGELILSDLNYLIKKIDARLNPACDYDFFKSIHIIQQYKSVSDSLYLPDYSRSECLLDIGIPKYPVLFVTKESWRENYKVNSKDGYPVGLEEQVKIQNDVKFSEIPMLIPPLTDDERNGYSRIDSLVRHNKFIFTLTKTMKLMDTYESIKKMPIGQFSDFYRFNRVEGSYGGLSINTDKQTSPFSLYLAVGYGFSDKKMKYNIAPKWENQIHAWKTSILFSNYSTLHSRETYLYYPIWLNTFSALFSGVDYFDYYYSKGNRIDLTISRNSLGYSVSVFKENHTQAFKNVSKNMIGKVFRDNIWISEGLACGYSLDMRFSNVAFRGSPLFQKMKPHQRFWEFEINYESVLRSWRSDFDYDRFELSARLRQNLFPRMLLDVAVNFGLSSSATPAQKMFSLTGGGAWYNQFKSFSTLGLNRFTGQKKYEIFTELNFTDYLFSIIKLNNKLNYELSLIVNHGWAGNSTDFDIMRKEAYTEMGFGVNKIFGIIKLEFIWGLQEIEMANSFSFNVKVDNFDIF